jgi:hypothetical protein
MIVDELFASGTLNLVYVAIVAISFIFALISLLGAEVGDALDFDLDVDGDTDFDFVNVSPFALATFGAAFGLVGLITRLWFDMAPIPSILWAAGLGALLGGLAQVLFIYVLSPSKSSHYSLQADAIGREAEVITTIPGKGLGEIAFNNVSGRVKLGARSVSGEEIPYGDVVIIKRIVGRVAFVKSLEL